MAESHFKTLLVLSGKPAFAASRSAVTQQLSTEQLDGVIGDAILSVVGRDSREALTYMLLDFVAKQRDTDTVGATTQNPVNIQSEASTPSSALPQANVSSLAPKSTKRKRKATCVLDHANADKEGVLSVHFPGMRPIRVDEFLYEVSVWAPLPSGGHGWCMLASVCTVWARKLHARIMEEHGHYDDWDELEERLDDANDSGRYPFGACINAVNGFTSDIPGYFSGSKEKACDGCVQSHSLCLKLVGRDLCVLPLPDEHRHGEARYSMDSFVYS